MRRDVSPEEKLLRLIKKSKKKEEPKKEEAAEKVEASGSASQAGKASARTASVPFPFTLRDFNTRAVNPILMIILAGLLLYFIYDIFYTSYHKKEVDVFAENGELFKAEEKEEPLDIKPYSYYSSAIEGRNIFLPQQVEIEAVVTGPTLEEISAGLSLIGIIAGDRPQAIIEDKKSGKSYFLYKGGLVGKTKIVEILEDSIVMEYQGERFELVL